MEMGAGDQVSLNVSSSLDKLSPFFLFQVKGKSDHYWIVGINENPQQLR